MRAIKEYLAFAGLSIKTRIGYRVDFILGSLGIILSNGLSLGMMAVLVFGFGTLGGWGIWELVFLYNLWLFSHGFYSTFFKNVENLGELIRTGEFDRFLLKPVNPLLQLIGSQFYFFGAGDWLISSTLLAISSYHLGLQWTLAKVGFFVLTVLASVLIETALSLIVNVLAFWFTRVEALGYLVFQFNYTLAQRYPIDIYFAPLPAILTFLLPYAFINFYPGLFFLDKLDHSPFGPVVPFLGLAVGLVFAFIAYSLWKVGLKHYDSTGS
jgi:ABC-2 type transport system permease protein